MTSSIINQNQCVIGNTTSTYYDRLGAVVRELASHQCGPRSTPGLGVILCALSLLLVPVLAPRGFSPGTAVFPSPQKPTFPNFNSMWHLRATGLSVAKTVKCHPR